MHFAPQCVICASKLIQGDSAVLPCGHVFHSACVSKWVNEAKSCPNCRKKCTLSEVSKLFFDYFDKNVPQTSTSEIDDMVENILETRIEELGNLCETLKTEINYHLEEIKEMNIIINSKNKELENKDKEIETLSSVITDYYNLKKENEKMNGRLKLCEFYKKISKGNMSCNVNILDKYLTDSNSVNVVNILNTTLKENEKLKELINESRMQQKSLIEEKLRLQKQIYDKNNLLNTLKNKLSSLDTMSDEKIEELLNLFYDSGNHDKASMGFDMFSQIKSDSDKCLSKNVNPKVSDIYLPNFKTPKRSEFDVSVSSFDSKEILEKLVKETNKKENSDQRKKEFDVNHSNIFALRRNFPIKRPKFL
ncbi:E3 ubiquitin-protein ligase TRAIP [Strongyloides ratti]|uniref:E3 ubiquitin-protein ligase TRAIP n=1 Tax=Strongyloides ratti TaxID=34506 RepID=A0A090MY28_STRRB|nr:E3 ubiquitin-protein ligase TRAIP [Strongyloides ratti]CEF66459.1 E3 ubiquitin-protein ligase TRAIP [Strongyloides ratti]